MPGRFSVASTQFSSTLLSSALFSILGAWILSAGLAAVQAQEPEKKEPAPPAAAPKDAATEPKSDSPFDKMFSEWKTLLSRLREIQTEYQIAKPDAKPALEKEFNELLAKGETLKPQMSAQAEASFKADPEKGKDAGSFLAATALSENRNDNYEEAARLATLLLEHKFQGKGLADLAGTASYEIADFEAAEKYLKEAKEAKSLGQQGESYLAELPTYKEYWDKEQELRAAEAKAEGKDLLPRVLLKTTAGDITLELFENEAPNTVANFVSLVEKKFYDGTPFHRVLPGFMAQGGDPTGTGTGGPGHTIACECEKPEHRVHFRGSISMAHAGKDTGGSQFFLTFRPTSHLNGKHTVFGRIVEGMDVLNKLKRRDPNDPKVEPDKIISATVLRKRDHEYKPEIKAEKK